MRYILIITFFLPSLNAFAAPELCLGTQYGQKGDTLAGEFFRCGYDPVTKQWGRHGGRFKQTKMSPRFHGIAHRTLPCGTKVNVCRLGRRRGEKKKTRCTVATVVDRGPYWSVPRSCMPGRIPSSACWRRGRPLVRNINRLPKTHPRKFANCGDLLPPVAHAIQLGGMAPISIEVVR